MNINNEKGYTLVTVLLVVLLLTILGGAYILAMNYEVRQSFSHDHRVKAYYYARTGAEAASKYLIMNRNSYFDFVEGEITFDEQTITISGDLENGLESDNPTKNDIEVKINFKPDQNNKRVEIESTGNYQKARETTTVVFRALDIFDKAVYSYTDIDATLESNWAEFKIDGSVETAGVVFGKENISGDSDEGVYRDYEEPNFPEGYEYWDTGGNFQTNPNQDNTIGSNEIQESYYQEIRANQELTIQVKPKSGENENDGIKRLVVDRLYSAGMTPINAVCLCPPAEDDDEPCLCDGVVHLYVTEHAEINTPDGGNEIPILIFLKEGATLKLAGNSAFKGFIYGPSATVEMRSNYTNIEGAMIVGELKKNEEAYDFHGAITYKRYPELMESFDFRDLFNYLVLRYWK